MTFVFDLDGTIIDSSSRHHILMKELLSDNGISTASDFADEYMKFKADGNSGKRYLTSVMGLDEQTASSIQNEWIRRIEDESLLCFDELYPDALNTLNKIEDNIIFLTIRSNEEGLRNELKRLNIDNYPVVVLSHGMNKADALRKIDGDLTIVGDTEIDYQAALDVNADFYILNRGFRSKEYWDKRDVPSHDDLSELIK